jgi:hypothetical protein
MRPTRRPSRPTTRPHRRRALGLAALALTDAGGPAQGEPSALLGADHPLVRALDALAVGIRQTLAAAGALATCAVAAAGGATWARAAGLSAAAVLFALVALAAGLRQKARRRALDLILEGREGLPLAAVERERRRLLKRRTRARLAASLARLLEEALTPPRPPVPGPSLLADAKVVRENARELCSVAALLRAPPASAGGVALVERLLTDGGSALYGNEVGALRTELGRARYMLESRARPVGR